MAYALVGSIGAVSVGTAGSTVTPAWGLGASRFAGDLLICFASCTGSGISIGGSVPSGWSLAQNASGASNSCCIFYKIATGAEAAPTIAAITGAVIVAQLAEFSGNATSSPRDQLGNSVGATTSPVTVTLGGADAAAGELLIISSADIRSVARATNDTFTSNHATITQAGSNNGVSSLTHYSFGYALATNSNSGADTAVMTASITSSITGMSVVGVTFKLFTGTVNTTTLTSSLSFIGSDAFRTLKKLVASVSYIGADAFKTFRNLIASVSYAGLLNKRLASAGYVANLSFIGNLTKGLLYLRSFSATLFQSGLNDGDPVSLWKDSSGNGHDATQSGFARPIFKKNVLNGYPVVRFASASSQYLSLSSAVSTVSPWTIMVVMKPVSVSVKLISLTNSTAATPLGPLSYSDGNIYEANRSGYCFINNNYYSTFHTYAIKDSDVTASTLWIDGSNIPMGAFAALVNNVDFDTIGARLTTPDYSDGDIAALLFYNVRLSDSDRNNIEAFWQVKYGTGANAGGTPTDPSAIPGLVGRWEADALSTVTLATLSKLPSKSLTATLAPVAAFIRAVKRSLTAAMPFIGTHLKRTSRSLTAAALSFIGTFSSTRFITRLLTGALSFAGSFSKLSGKILTGVLSFIGADASRTSRPLSGVLSFIGTQIKRQPFRLSSTLSFVGSFTKKAARLFSAQGLFNQFNQASIKKKINKASSGILSFIGGLATQFTGGAQLYLQSVAGTLSFIGSDAFNTLKNLAASLPFIGSLKGRLGKLFAGTLSFVGTANRNALRFLAATLSFVGNFASLLSHLGSHLLSVSANLAFVGNLNQSTKRSLAAVLSFAGAMGKRLPKLFTAALSFIGALPRRVTRALAGALSFIGILTTKDLYARLLTATLNFTGSVSNRTRRTLAAALSFVGNLGRRLPLRLSATLAFTGILLKQAQKRFSGLVSYIGSLSSTRALLRLLVSTVGFVGTLKRSLPRLLASALTLAADFTKSTRKVFTGLLGLVGLWFVHQGAQLFKSLSGTLSFSGSIIRRIGQVIKISVARIIQAIQVGLFKETIAVDVALPKPQDEVKIQVQEDTELVSVSTAGNPAEIEITVPGDIDN